MNLLLSKVPRALETKTKLFGIELSDLLLIFIYLSVSNLIFGATRLKFPIVWLGTFALFFVMYFLKRGKPENYLQHLGEFYTSPGVLSAGADDLDYQSYFGLFCEET
ncbi:MAG: hypothetical protein HY843_08000 [Bdellovibrio sp.]|nr:hypothetical protein [Bdellovibrio sp.]